MQKVPLEKLGSGSTQTRLLYDLHQLRKSLIPQNGRVKVKVVQSGRSIAQTIALAEEKRVHVVLSSLRGLLREIWQPEYTKNAPQADFFLALPLLYEETR